MSTWRLVGINAIVLILAAVLDVGIGQRGAIFGAHASFLLLALAFLGSMGSLKNAMTVGFVAGLIQGGLAGANLNAYCLTRLLAGLAVGFLWNLEMDRSVVTFAASTLVAILVGQLGLLFLAPPVSIGPFIGETVSTLVVNLVLSVPIGLLLLRSGRRHRRFS